MFIFCGTIFLSTLSLRRATSFGVFYWLKVTISIHALLAESDNYRLRPTNKTRYFYPRSPCGERLEFRKLLYPSSTNFYPRSPCGERLDPRVAVDPRVAISIHALLAESDFTHQHSRLFLKDFYPRSPCGERPVDLLDNYQERAISIHALLAESDLLVLQSIVVFLPISIHALLAESDEETAAAEAKAAQISIHALLAESDVSMSSIRSGYSYFYPRSPCGERHAG